MMTPFRDPRPEPVPAQRVGSVAEEREVDAELCDNVLISDTINRDAAGVTGTTTGTTGGYLTQPLRILFVEDDQVTLNVLRRVLASEGFAIFSTLDSLAVLGLVLEHHIDVVVADFSMPVMNGEEVLEVVRKACPEVVRVILSGQGRDRDAAARTVKQGTTSRYIEKPWNGDQLVKVFHDIRDEVEKRKRREQGG